MPISDINGIVDQNFIDQQVAATAGLNTGNTGGFDPNLFLKVLSATLANQSPFDTMDTQEILNTQAQLTQVEQVSKQTEHIKDMQSTLETQTANMVLALAYVNSTVSAIAEKIGAEPTVPPGTGTGQQ